jgi:hypothetical protein
VRSDDVYSRTLGLAPNPLAFATECVFSPWTPVSSKNGGRSANVFACWVVSVGLLGDVVLYGCLVSVARRTVGLTNCDAQLLTPISPSDAIHRFPYHIPRSMRLVSLNIRLCIHWKYHWSVHKSCLDIMVRESEVSKEIDDVRWICRPRGTLGDNHCWRFLVAVSLIVRSYCSAY